MAMMVEKQGLDCGLKMENILGFEYECDHQTHSRIYMMHFYHNERLGPRKIKQSWYK